MSFSPMLASWFKDLKFASRMLARAPGYTFAAVLTLALAMAATTTTFSVVDGVLLRSLPYPQPQRLVRLEEKEPQLKGISISLPDLYDWQAAQKSFTSIAGYRTDNMNLTGFSTPAQVRASLVSWDLFDVLGVHPILGRSFTAEEGRAGAPAPVALLGHSLWEGRFASDPSIVGRTITLDGKPFTVVGVLPETLAAFAGHNGAFIPLAWTPAVYNKRGSHPGLYAIGRLKPGVSLSQAREDLEAIGHRLEGEYPRENGGLLPELAPLQEATVGDLRSSLVLMLCAAAFVLLIAIANVANLMLARGTVRRREMAVRAALGAGRAQLVRQLLVESALVGLLSGVAGVLLSLWGVAYLSANRPQAIPSFLPIEVDGAVLSFSIAVAVVSGVLFGVLPAVQISRTDLTTALKEGDVRGGTGHGNRVRGALVVAEVALAVMLLVGAGLAIRAFSRVLQVDTGMKPDHLLTFSYTLPEQKYPTLETRRAFHRRFQAELESIPGVKSVTLSYGMPLQGAPENSFAFEGEPQVSAGEAKMGNQFSVEPGFFETYGISILRGRAFTQADVSSGARKIIVDEELARKYLDPKDPFSKRFAGYAPLEIPTGEIVGIARHITHDSLEGKGRTQNQFYILWETTPPKLQAAMIQGMDVAIRTEVDPATLMDAVRRAATNVDPDQPVFDVKTMEQRVQDATASRRFSMTLMAVFGGLALLIAAMGLYAVIGYSVSQRTREVGIRMALGAQPGEVRRMVVSQGMRLTGVGLALGIAGALVLAQLMRSFLFSVGPTDPVTFAAVLAMLTGVGFVASWMPARRASRVAPMIALRQD